MYQSVVMNIRAGNHYCNYYLAAFAGKLAVGVGSGFVIFVMLFFSIGFWERHVRLKEKVRLSRLPICTPFMVKNTN